MAQECERPMNRDERRMLARLVRRRDHLQELVDSGKAVSWDRSEVGALNWAIHRVTESYKADP